MCNQTGIDFGIANLKRGDIEGKYVLEVGSLDVNGSLREIVEKFHPCKYIGVDIEKGKGVDEICDATDLIRRFGCNKFDVLISTELLEHVKNWKKVISNFKNVLKTEGIIIITTRSKGFGYHDHPYDFWRYEISDIKFIFSDFTIETIEKDPGAPGVFMRAKKQKRFIENKLTDYRLYSVLPDRKMYIIKSNLISAIKSILIFIAQRLPLNMKRKINKIYKIFKYVE